MKQQNWKSLIKAELNQAEAARVSGNHGKARVCARRAAGIAIGEFLRRGGIESPGPSAYDRLQFMSTYPEASDQIREICQHLILRVDEGFKLPIEVDLIAETYELVKALLGQP